MRPIFFSVSSQEVKFAEKIWEKLPADLVYVYSKSGVEGEHLWREISDRELANARYFVVFWSEQYVHSNGCLKELTQAKEIVQSGKLVPLVIRLDDYPIIFNSGLEASTKPVFDDLGPLLTYRTSRPSIPLNDAIALVTRIVEPALESDHPRLTRGEMLDNLSRATRRADGEFTCYPAMWISGFNGVGRLSLIKELSRNYSGESRCVVVEVNETSLPKQVLLRVHDEAFGGGKEALDRLNSDPNSESPIALANKIEDAVATGRTVVFRHHRVVEEGAELPGWVDEVVNCLTPKNRTKLFIVSQIPLTAARRHNCQGKVGEYRVPTLSDEETEEFAKQLIAHFDPNPQRWHNHFSRLTQVAGGSPGFLVSVIRSAAGIDDLEEIEQLLRRNNDRMAESITGYVRWAFRQLVDYPNEQRALLILNNISPIQHEDLAKLLGGEKPVLQVLGKLLSLGLVERERGGLYRLAPLLANRLNRDIVLSDAKSWYRVALRHFAITPVEFTGDGNDVVRIESRISASLWQGGGDIHPDAEKFVSAAHWFQIGVRLYHAQHREPAYRILKKAFERRGSFRDASAAELTRYFGLSAIRNGKLNEAQEAIDILNRNFNTRGLAKYLEAFREERQRHYKAALDLYEEALELNAGNVRRLERIYRPLIKCIFKSPWPDYSRAERHALAWLRMRDTVFAKVTLAQTYLNWWKKGPSQNREPPTDVQAKYNDALAKLNDDPGVGSGYFEVKSEEARLEGDYPAAIAYLQEAINSDPNRFELRLERWQLMAESNDVKICVEAASELELAKKNPEYASNWRPFLESLTEVYVRALYSSGVHDNGRIQRFASGLSAAEIGNAVNVARRGDPIDIGDR